MLQLQSGRATSSPLWSSHTVDRHLVHSLGSARDRDRREWLHAEPEVFSAKVEAFLARLRTGTIFSNLGR